MVEVFKTNVREPGQSERIRALLLCHFPGLRISFDLEDCDRILRVEGAGFTPEMLVRLVRENGFSCQLLEE